MPALRKILKRSALALGGLVLAVAAWDVATYDRDAWLGDYARLKHDMAQGYANLDWMVAHRGMDLAALDRDTTARLTSAHSRLRAFIALRDFVKAFGDPHLRMSPGERPTTPPAPMASVVEAEPQDPLAGVDCASSGYEEGERAFRFPFHALPGWKPLPGANFPSGVAGDVGVLRIASLGEDRYLGACAAVVRKGMGQHALKPATRARLQGELRRTLAGLRNHGARRLLVDVTGNGGGTEWVSEVIALLTDRTLVRQGARMVAAACDRSAVWSNRRPACEVVGPATEETTIVGTGAWRGPLFVLTDRGTGSAAEDLVAWLADNEVATILGARTAGAGCGYVNGGTVTHLSQVPVDVRMPNCARFLRDGTNEVEGLEPDVVLPEGDGALAALRAALRG